MPDEHSLSDRFQDVATLGPVIRLATRLQDVGHNDFYLTTTIPVLPSYTPDCFLLFNTAHFAFRHVPAAPAYFTQYFTLSNFLAKTSQ